MKILCACEESQAVTIQLRRLGHEAYSCDIQDCSGGFPEWHIKGDVLPLLSDTWDMIIAFPPCTYHVVVIRVIKDFIDIFNVKCFGTFEEAKALLDMMTYNNYVVLLNNRKD